MSESIIMARFNDSKVFTSVVIVVIGFAILVWPTRYRFEHITLGSSASVFVRLDRFTGHAEMLTASGWTKMVEPKSHSGPESLPSEQVSKLDATATLCGAKNTLCLDLYNGSTWRLSEISITIAAANEDASVKWDGRRFDANGLDIPAFSTKRIYIDTLETVKISSWFVSGATGTLEIKPLVINLPSGPVTQK